MKDYNVMRRLIKGVYGLIAFELNMKYEIDAFMSKGVMTRDAMF